MSITPMVTGHRPDKLGGYGLWHGQTQINRTQGIYNTMLKYLDENAPIINYAISGMALGIDMLWAHACLETGVPFLACIPTPLQYERWPEPSQEEWHELIGQAMGTNVSSPTYFRGVENRRNQHMVQKATYALCYWNGDNRGGTYNCIQLIRQAKMPHKIYHLVPRT